jgi:putative endonuclease
MKTYYVYILRNPGGKLYIGLTENLQQRLADHNSGVSTWTRGKGPWELIWSKGPLSLSEARKLESFLKRQKGGAGLYNYTGLKKQAHNPAAAGSQIQILAPQPIWPLKA